MSHLSGTRLTTDRTSSSLCLKKEKKKGMDFINPFMNPASFSRTLEKTKEHPSFYSYELDGFKES